MRLQRAATAFDKMECLDAYNGRLAFMGQLALYDDSRRDSEATERRVISTSADSVPPARLVVSAAGTRFIMGRPNPDSYRGKVIRVGWACHEATELMHIRTLGQTCRKAGGTAAYAGMAWGKNVADNEQSADLFGQFRVYLSKNETVLRGHVLVGPSGVHVVRSAHVGPAGFLVALADRMDPDCLAQATLTSRVVNWVDETRTDVEIEVDVFTARWQSIYEYQSTLAPKFGPTDLQVAIAKSQATAKTGDTLALRGQTWQIDSVADEGDAWLCRAVRHG